jgi:hypothetical protein
VPHHSGITYISCQKPIRLGKEGIRTVNVILECELDKSSNLSKLWILRPSSARELKCIMSVSSIKPARNQP